MEAVQNSKSFEFKLIAEQLLRAAMGFPWAFLRSVIRTVFAKKAIEGIWWVIIGAIIAAIALLVAFAFLGLLNKYVGTLPG